MEHDGNRTGHRADPRADEREQHGATCNVAPIDVDRATDRDTGQERQRGGSRTHASGRHP
jgi:hypothetical protein